MTEKIHVLLPVHNRRETTRRFIECLRAQTYSNYHLILIDDGSTDGTAEMVLESIPGATVIRGRGDWWWAGSLQQGLDWLKSAKPADLDVVLFINDDVLFDADYLENGRNALRHHPQSMVLSQLRDPRSGEVRESGVHADLRKMIFTIASSASEVNCLSTRGLFITWGDVTKIGAFRPSFLPHYWSDYEYTIRAARRGLACYTTKLVWLEADFCSTGDRDLGAEIGWEYVRRLFSIKYIHNPVFISAFVVCAVPARWVIPNLLRIWWGAIRRLFRQGVLQRSVGN